MSTPSSLHFSIIYEYKIYTDIKNGQRYYSETWLETWRCNLLMVYCKIYGEYSILRKAHLGIRE